MSASEARSEIVMELAEEFLERYRKGERPGLKEYADRHPELAGEIREVFPAMAMMENIAIQDDSLVGEQTEAQGTGISEARLLEQLGDFRIIREIGHGGMGVVYAAEQVSLGRQVALKVLSSQMLRDSKHRRRFEREAKAAAKLHHTNIVPVFGVGEHEGSAYYVMQYIQGLGLDQVIEELQRMRAGGKGSADAPAVPRSAATRGDLSVADMAHSLLNGRFDLAGDAKTPAGTEIAATLATTPSGGHAFTTDDRTDGATPLARDTKTRSTPASISRSSVILPGASSDGGPSRSGPATYWQSVARIGVQVADGLEYAHRQGVLHRDIKPSNLLLDSRGTVWVTDFGLAKTEDHQNLTHTGDILGTLRYMPPEAFEGKFDARGDVYALGLTLYELLALRPAFDDRDRHRLVKRVMHESPERLEQLNREIPRDLVTIVHKAIAREPDHRYVDAEAMEKDLGRFLEGRPILVRRVSATERTWRWCRRNPVIAGMLVMMVAALAGVLGLWFRSERLLALTRRQAVGLQLDQSLSLCEQGYVDRGLLAMAEQLQEHGTSPAAEQHAIRANLAAWSAKLIVPQTLATRIVTGRHVPASNENLWASVDEDGAPQLWDLATGKSTGKDLEPIKDMRQTPGGTTRPPPALWFSDDGKVLMGRGRDGWVRSWNLDTGRLMGPSIEVRWAFDPNGVLYGLEISEDHRLLVTVSDKQVWRWDVATGRPVTTAWRAEVSPESSIVAFYPHRVITRDRKSGVYRLFDLDSGQMIGRPMPSAPTSNWHEVKEIKALCLWEQTDQERWIQGWNVQTGEALGPRWSMKGKSGELVHAPVGSNLVFVVGDTIVVRDLATGKQQGEAFKTKGRVRFVRVLPEQRLFLGTDGGGQTWDLSTRSQVFKELNIAAQSSLWAVSSDARRVVLMRFYSTTSELVPSVELWDVPTVNRLLTLSYDRKIDYETVALDSFGMSLTFISKDHTLNRCDLSRSVTEHPLLDDASVSSLIAIDKAVYLRYLVRPGNRDQTVIEIIDNETLSATGPGLHVDAPAKVWVCSPRNDLILTGCDDGSARIWSPITLAPVGVAMRHSRAVTSAAFSPDGRFIATGSGRTARLWDVYLCRPIGPSMEHPTDIKGVYFSTDGHWLLVKCDAQGAYRWPVPSPMEGDADRVLARVMELTR